MKKTLRLKLSDFIYTDVEDDIINFLQLIKKDFSFNVLFWYKQDELDNMRLNRFKAYHNDKIEEIEATFNVLNFYEMPVWYDIINVNDKDLLSHYKFRSLYTNVSEIIDCIMEFNSMIKFDIQKNNGYKNDKNRNNRFKTVGK